ncbi:hypothetical protein C4569_02165 [Candidatus Parcubacteria bacterium]|nr:MAG: hypothetical protein C4569_02165 [Candidatus Parcubacteria bacterium]
MNIQKSTAMPAFSEKHYKLVVGIIKMGIVPPYFIRKIREDISQILAEEINDLQKRKKISAIYLGLWKGVRESWSFSPAKRVTCREIIFLLVEDGIPANPVDTTLGYFSAKDMLAYFNRKRRRKSPTIEQILRYRSLVEIIKKGKGRTKEKIDQTLLLLYDHEKAG